MLGNGFNEAKRYEEALTFLKGPLRQAAPILTQGFRLWRMKGSLRRWPARQDGKRERQAESGIEHGESKSKAWA